MNGWMNMTSKCMDEYNTERVAWMEEWMDGQMNG